MANRRTLSACAALVLCGIVPSQAQQLRCEIIRKFACEGGTECKSVPISVWNVVDLSPGAPTFQRCDRNGCDTYPTQPHTSGIFVVIDVPGRGMVAKFNIQTLDFVEVVTLGTSVLNSFGTCRRQ